jgi:hypothetical protein
VDDGIDLAALGGEVGERFPEMARLRDEPVLPVHIEMHVHRTRFHAVITMVDEHDDVSFR